MPALAEVAPMPVARARTALDINFFVFVI